MKRAYDPDTNTVRDLRIDDSAMPLAKNFFDFCFNILGKDVRPPFARQMWIAYTLLSEYCPDCTKPKWYEDIENIEVDMDPYSLRKKVAFLEYGVCPFCTKTKGQLIEEGKLFDKTDLILLLGQRSGKSTISTLLAAYVTHHLVKAPRLSKLCSGIQDFTPLSSTFTATTAAQAIKTLWNPFKKIIAASSWFKNYFSMLDEYKAETGKELYQFNPASGLYLRFFHKNLELYSSGPAKRTLRGDTRFFCVAQDSLVLTTEGEKPIQTVRRKDRVLVGTEEFRVKALIANDIRFCVELELANGNKLICTSDHKIRVFSKYQIDPFLWYEAKETLGELVVIQQEETRDTVNRTDRKNLGYSTCIAVRSVGFRQVYDLSIDSEEHAFIANNILVHNCATDELSYFPFNVNETDEDGEEERERANADEVHQSLVNSLATVQAGIMEARKKGVHHIPQAMFANISSPYSWLDKACRLYLENQDNPYALCVKKATWEISPMYLRDNPVIVAAYKRNAKKAERDFGANPPKIGSDFYSKESVLKCFQLSHQYKLSHQPDSRYTKAKLVELQKKDKLLPAVLSIDAGVNNNAFGVTLTTRVGASVYVEVLLELVPQPGTEIHYPDCYESILKPLIKDRNVKVLVADRFNSLQILQQARDDFPDIKAVQYSVKLQDFHNVLNLVATENLFFPKLDLAPERVELVTNYKVELLQHPADHLYLQCITVQELGGTVVKGQSPSGVKYTDDIHRAMVLGVAAVTSEKVSKHLAKFKALEKSSTNAPQSRVLVAGRLQSLLGLRR